MMKTRKCAPEERHLALRDDLIAVLRKYEHNTTAAEMLAIASHMVGQMVALQDQRVMTGKDAIEIVAQNIEEGNKEVIDGLFQTTGPAS